MPVNKSIIMAGVVPPPVHGQSLATKALFDADITSFDKYVVEIRSSKSIKDVGKASIGKVLGLLPIILRVLRKKIQTRSRIFYYTAGSAAVVPFIRDILLLGILRPFFSKTLIHYHSGGLPQFLEESSWRRVFGKWIYGRGAWAISLNEFTPVPGIEWGAEKELVLPNGLDVDLSTINTQHKLEKQSFNILFLGNLHDDKGIFDLLEAAKLLAKQTSKKVKLQFVGKWPSDAIRNKFFCELQDLPKNLEVPIPEPKYGEDKWLAYSEADLFAFPTYYKAENFPLVVIEAMAMSLPVLATNWRGLPAQVDDGNTGWLVDTKSPDQLADVLCEAINNKELLSKMGKNARRSYEAKFTMNAHISKFAKIVDSAICA